MRRVLPILLCFIVPAHAADRVPVEFQKTFNTVVREAEALLKKSDLDGAIARYEKALVDDLAGYGRVHLRLGQLYQRAKRFASAARHYRDCDGDDRVDALDRELICQEGFKATTAPLTVDGVPEDGQVVILEPTLFAGPLTSGMRVPLGPLKVVVDTPNREARESVIQVEGPTRWTAAVGLRRGRRVVPSGFVTDDVDPIEVTPTGAVRWPAYLAAGVGLGLAGTGVWLGIDNRAELDDIRARQRARACAGICAADLQSAETTALVADGLWIGGAVVAASSVLLWFLFDGTEDAAHDEPIVDEGAR